MGRFINWSWKHLAPPWNSLCYHSLCQVLALTLALTRAQKCFWFRQAIFRQWILWNIKGHSLFLIVCWGITRMSNRQSDKIWKCGLSITKNIFLNESVVLTVIYNARIFISFTFNFRERNNSMLLLIWLFELYQSWGEILINVIEL